MENNQIAKYEGDALHKLTNVILITNKILKTFDEESNPEPNKNRNLNFDDNLIIDADWVPISASSVLHANSMIANLEMINDKRFNVQYVVIRKNISTNKFSIQKMSSDGIAIGKKERDIIEIQFDSLIDRKFYLCDDKSGDRHRWPKSEKDAIEIIYLLYNEKELAEIKEMNQNEFTEKYSSLAHWIRNYFGLWRGNFDLLLDCDARHPEPDNVSNKIILKFWESLTKKKSI